VATFVVAIEARLLPIAEGFIRGDLAFLKQETECGPPPGWLG
jgi:hypothetical protein